MNADEQSNGRDDAAGRRQVVVRRRRDMDYTPVRNGMDFLVSAFDHLSQRDGKPGARDLKYAVLHLQAAVEVLLKARLIQEHWSLVFSDPGKAKKADYDKGSFQSCTVLGAVDRLNNIVSLQISKEQREAIKNLADTRNALTHLGHTSSVYAVESQAAYVLDFLVNFIHEELRPALSEDPRPALSKERHFVEATMGQLRARLGEVKALVKRRIERLEPELKASEGFTVQCPSCQQWALVLGEEASCRFCLSGSDPEWAVTWYADSYGTGEVQLCPNCDEHTVVVEASVAQSKQVKEDICFQCAGRYTGWLLCENGCEAIIDPSTEMRYCAPCLTSFTEGF